MRFCVFLVVENHAEYFLIDENLELLIEVETLILLHCKVIRACCSETLSFSLLLRQAASINEEETKGFLCMNKSLPNKYFPTSHHDHGKTQ